jgi:hypothetical protein
MPSPREQIEQHRREAKRAWGGAASRVRKPHEGGGVQGDRTGFDPAYPAAPFSLRHTTPADGDPWRHEYGVGLWLYLVGLYRRWRKGEVKRIRIDVIETPTNMF